MDEVLKDARFAHIANDPKFKRIPKSERKIKIDKRFQSMFKDKKFSVTYTIDKRGRPMTQTSTENLRKYYDISNSEDESDNELSTSETTKETGKKEKEKKLDKKKKKETDTDKESKDELSTPKATKESHKKEKLKKQVEEKKKETDKIKKNQIRQKDNENEDVDEASSNDSSSSREKLLPLRKPEEDSDTDSEEHNKSESESDTENEVGAETTKVDIDKNEKQLHIRRENEATNISNKVKEKLKDLSINYARGEGVLLTDSSSDEESSEYSDEEEIEHKWGELDKEADTTEEVTHRLALCNMDWDRIRAIDLMVLFNSFLPSGGLIRSVTIYPSEFGQQRMKEEELNGPRELTETKEDRENDDENDDEDGSEYHREKLRQYQLNRLKYYYAVIVFDTAETANKVYTECDGLEYESTSTKLDLRFIPDDMEFDQTPKEVCDEIPEFSKYEPRQFITTALQQVKVQLTWDETNPERQEFAQKLNSGKLDEISENDLNAYLASETSDEESEKEEKPEKDENNSEAETNADPIEKYKSLLKDIEEQEELKKKKEVELEFTWGLGTKEKAEKMVQERLKKDESLTPFEQYLEKRKAKKKAKREERKKLREGRNEDGTDSEDMVSDTGGKSVKKLHSKGKTVADNDDNDDGSISSENEDEEQRKAELELLLMDDNESNEKQHFNMKKIEENATMSKSKQKRLSKKKNGQSDLKEDEFEVNVADPRFNALFTSHHFNMDPTDPHFRKTKGSDALIKEKLKRRAEESNDVVEAKQPKADKKLDTELQSLVKSVKRNTKNISRPIK